MRQDEILIDELRAALDNERANAEDLRQNCTRVVAENKGLRAARLSEAAVEAGAKVLADACDRGMIDAPKLPAPCWMGLARAVIKAALEQSAEDK